MGTVEPIRNLKDLQRIEKILSKNPRDLLFFTMGTNWGLRISDIVALDVSDVRVDLCEYALEFVGNPYVWGGTSLTKGADCSGFVLSVFKKFGVSLPHHSGSQAKEGTKIKAADLQPGDLVFYANSSGTINHVAIYIGGGQVIHASSPETGIKISKYNYRTPVKCVSILQD